ncbi:L,D-transpeptidase [Nitratireductor rhodophyticola]|uniref:L,D-transpeptidase n=1 Tax=Nitratireductor rhodophyticola TaxID=2854036 RepID=UPI0009F2B2F2
MIDRRVFVLSVAVFLAVSGAAYAHPVKKPVELDPRFMPQLVDISFEYEAGTLVVDPKNRFLYLAEGPGTARRYGVGVGRAGLSFTGSAVVGRKAKWPSWRPTKNMIRRDPQKYAKYADGVPGGPTNPLGSRALYLYRDGRDTLYRIHGTTEPSSIGKAVSNGCIRMLNEHVEDLFERVSVGTKVVVLE